MQPAKAQNESQTPMQNESTNAPKLQAQQAQSSENIDGQRSSLSGVESDAPSSTRPAARSVPAASVAPLKPWQVELYARRAELDAARAQLNAIWAELDTFVVEDEEKVEAVRKRREVIDNLTHISPERKQRAINSKTRLFALPEWEARCRAADDNYGRALYRVWKIGLLTVEQDREAFVVANPFDDVNAGPRSSLLPRPMPSKPIVMKALLRVAKLVLSGKVDVESARKDVMASSTENISKAELSVRFDMALTIASNGEAQS